MALIVIAAKFKEAIAKYANSLAIFVWPYFALDIAAIADDRGPTIGKWLGEWIVYVFALYKGTASVYMVGLDVKAVYELGLEAS